ncbi:CU044_5270 family protein [Amycolatopsis sp. NPDC059657]|uniref:CU044_5270 family protein n=1 Tax=Amycolatopsis sp. NPDC059657 TaxID=3346899 RepID=UPI00366F9579
MDELQLLKEAGDKTPLVTLAELAPARARLEAAIGASQAPRTRRRRLVWGGAGVIGLAAAITAVIAIAPVDEVAPQAVADPVRVLTEAAAAALLAPDVEPRPDQLIYTKTQNPDSVRESWLSVDGEHDGLIKQSQGDFPLPGCINGKAQVIKGDEPIPGLFEACKPSPSYLRDLPTDPDAMLAYLLKNHSGAEGDVNALGKDVASLANERYLRPAARAALFRAAAKVPGLSVVENAKDGMGRLGIGITWPTPHGSSKDAKPMILVFDPKTGMYLGSRNTAVVTRAIVDRIGDHP